MEQQGRTQCEATGNAAAQRADAYGAAMPMAGATKGGRGHGEQQPEGESRAMLWACRSGGSEAREGRQDQQRESEKPRAGSGAPVRAVVEEKGRKGMQAK